MTDSSEARAAAILRGDRRAVARAITSIENGEPSTITLLKRLFLSATPACIIGITGAPGAGKSTLVEKLALAYRRRGLRVGILAVDPTSPFSGGAILGDRIRMQRLASDDGIYIRSMATRGLLGGLAPGVWDAVVVLEACGCATVMVETVGVGQDEVEIAKLADVTLLLLVPNMGDGVQAFKAGVMEIADLFVINKSDCGDAGRTEREVAVMLSGAGSLSGRRPAIVKTIATTGEGIDDLVREIEDFRSFAQRTPAARLRTEARWRTRILEMVRQRLIARTEERFRASKLLGASVERIAERQIDPYTVAEELTRELVIE